MLCVPGAFAYLALTVVHSTESMRFLRKALARVTSRVPSGTLPLPAPLTFICWKQPQLPGKAGPHALTQPDLCKVPIPTQCF